MSKIKFKLCFETYYKPTPKNIRKWGDGLLGISTFISGFSMLGNERWLAITALAVGVAGKFLSNFFSESPPDEN